MTKRFAGLRIRFLRLEEFFEAIYRDTTTNEVKSRLTALENRLDAEEAKCPLPVGAVMRLSSADDPNTMDPGTTWTKIEGKVLLGTSSSYSVNYPGLLVRKLTP